MIPDCSTRSMAVFHDLIHIHKSLRLFLVQYLHRLDTLTRRLFFLLGENISEHLFDIQTHILHTGEENISIIGSGRISLDLNDHKTTVLFSLPEAGVESSRGLYPCWIIVIGLIHLRRFCLKVCLQPFSLRVLAGAVYPEAVPQPVQPLVALTFSCSSDLIMFTDSSTKSRIIDSTSLPT